MYNNILKYQIYKVYLKENSNWIQMKYRSVAKDRSTMFEMWQSTLRVRVAK